MDADCRPMLDLLPYQLADLRCDARFRWCCWSRQTGKSFTKSLRRILRGLCRRRTQVFLSAGERQSRELMLKARQHCQALKIATDYHDDQAFAGTCFKQLELVLPNHIRIIGLPANPQTARGFTGDVLLDEFAMHADDRDIWAAMFPTLLRGEGELDVASTPKGCGNVFYRLRDNPLFSHSTVTLPDAIAAGLPVDLEQVRRSMADEQLFRQEFLCEFLDESTAFLTWERIVGCEDESLAKRTTVRDLAERGQELFIGVDIGRHHDLTVIWVLTRHDCNQEDLAASTQQSEIGNRKPLTPVGGVKGGSAILMTRAVFELSCAPFRAQSALLSELLSLRCVRRCCVDAGGLGMQLAESAVEDFGAHRVEPVTFTAALKSELAGALRIAVEERRIRIPPDEAIRNDWHSLERSVSAGGYLRFEASRTDGSHADRFWAAALALHAAGAGAARVESLPTDRLAYARTGAW